MIPSRWRWAIVLAGVSLGSLLPAWTAAAGETEMTVRRHVLPLRAAAVFSGEEAEGQWSQFVHGLS